MTLWRHEVDVEDEAIEDEWRSKGLHITLMICSWRMPPHSFRCHCQPKIGILKGSWETFGDVSRDIECDVT
jgi:hypothetical protein